MLFTFTSMTEAEAREILAWRYDGEYAEYDIEDTPELLAELLDSRSPYYAVRNEANELVGWFACGTSAEVSGTAPPALWSEGRMLSVGLGLRPDLTGKGLGLGFVLAGLDFARTAFAPNRFRMYVLPFNSRALRVYERAGFLHTGTAVQRGPQGERVFLELCRDA